MGSPHNHLSRTAHVPINNDARTYAQDQLYGVLVVQEQHSSPRSHYDGTHACASLKAYSEFPS